MNPSQSRRKRPNTEDDVLVHDYGLSIRPGLSPLMQQGPANMQFLAGEGDAWALEGDVLNVKKPKPSGPSHNGQDVHLQMDSRPKAYSELYSTVGATHVGRPPPWIVGPVGSSLHMSAMTTSNPVCNGTLVEVGDGIPPDQPKASSPPSYVDDMCSDSGFLSTDATSGNVATLTELTNDAPVSHGKYVPRANDSTGTLMPSTRDSDHTTSITHRKDWSVAGNFDAEGKSIPAKEEWSDSQPGCDYPDAVSPTARGNAKNPLKANSPTKPSRLVPTVSDGDFHSANFVTSNSRYANNRATANVLFLRNDIVKLAETTNTKRWNTEADLAREIKKIKVQPNLATSNTEFLRGDATDLNPHAFPPSSSSQSSVKSPKVAIEVGRRRASSRLQTFIYPPLGEEPGSFRLIKIDAPSKEDPSLIRCTLTSCEPWTGQLQYQCLSYCWGDRQHTRQLLVRTSEDSERDTYRPFSVTANLASALRSLRATHSGKWLWIDAICIDQENLLERAAQVGFMKEIYNQAAGIVIWLGESTRSLSAAVATIQTISKSFQKASGISIQDVIGPAGLQLGDKELALLKSPTLLQTPPLATEQAYEEVAAFFSLPWFRRVWVLQEAFSPTFVTARLGSQTFPWGSLILAALWQSFLARAYTARPVLSQGIEGILCEKNARGYLPELWLGLLHSRTPRGLSVVELVCRGRDFQATDPRDKVFALLGLSNDLGPSENRSSGLLPDYTKSKERVYCDFARDLISLQGNLDVLSAVNTFGEPFMVDDSAVISWMPNFDVSIATIRGFGFPRKYNSSLSTRATTKLSSQCTDHVVLPLHGFQLTTIASITDTIFMHKTLQLRFSQQSNVLPWLWTSYVQASVLSPSHGSFLASFIHTITAAGFASPDHFPEHPLGNVVSSHKIPSITADFAAHWAKSNFPWTAFSFSDAEQLRALAPYGDAEQFGVLVGKACHERRFMITAEGHMGVCPRGAEAGDLIVVLHGGSVPYVLRPKGDGEYHAFVGECYVQGMMFGEAMEKQRMDGIDEVVFKLR